MSPTIPRRLIQTARSRALPPLAAAAAANLKLLHPDWEYLFFDDHDVNRFVATEFPQYQRVFESFPRRIQRFDFFRYLAVLRHGGFYFDLDVLFSERLDELLGHACVFPFEELTLNSHLRQELHIDWELGNYGFGASPDHPFLAAVVENCVKAATDPRWAAPLLAGVPSLFRSDFHVLNTTGPGLVTRTYAENPESARSVHIVCPGDVEDEANWHRFGRFGIHLMEASWRSRHGFLRRRLARWWEQSRRRSFAAAPHAASLPRRPRRAQPA